MASDGQHASPEGYVFIVTYGRSGSTLLQSLLNTIPGYQIRGENNNALLHLASAWSMVADSKSMRNLRRLGSETDPTHPWCGAEKVCPQQLGQELAESFVRTVLKPDPGVRVSGFKEIRFHAARQFFDRYLDFIYDNFPNTRFVMNTRDHAGVANSGWWKDLPFAEVDETITEADTMFEAYRKTHPDRCFHVHYDDYVKDVRALEPMFEFLGERFDIETVERVMSVRLDHAK